VFWSGCDSSGGPAFPAPAKQFQSVEAGGENRRNVTVRAHQGNLIYPNAADIVLKEVISGREGQGMLEIVIIFCVVVSIVWIVWKLRAHDQALEKATLDQAWRVVLDDPHYEHRRQYEERKHEDEARLRREAEGL
jgi:hypothetical protein